MDPRPTWRTITVGGEGEVQVVPDLARVVFNVETTHAELARAQAENASRLAAVIARLTALGVAERDLQTSRYTVQPQHDYNRQGRLIGYQVFNGVRVTVRDLARLSELLDGAVAAGANLVHGARFDMSDKEDALRRAREAAVRDAHAKAEQYAALTGVQLGPPVTITEGGRDSPMAYAARFMPTSMSMAEQAPPTPVEPGEQTIRLSVQITYEIRPLGRRSPRRGIERPANNE